MLQTNMLQTDRLRAPAFNDEAEGGGIGEIISAALGFLWRQYLVLILAAVLGLTASLIYLLITPPTYTAQVQVMLENAKTQFIQQQSILAEPAFDLTLFETQVQVLKSKAMAIKVINQLKLADDPDFKQPPPSSPSHWQRLRAALLPSPPDDLQPAPTGEPLEGIVTTFQKRTVVDRIGFSNLIEINFSSSNPIRAAQIANAIAKVYLADQEKAKLETNRRARTWMQERLQELGEQALEAERAVSAYKSKNNLISTGGKPIDDQQITDLSSRLVAARAQTSDAAAKLNRYEAILEANPANSPSIGNLDAAGSDALSSPIITSLRQQYLELERRVAEWVPRFGRDHAAVVNLRNRMRELRGSILDEVKRYAETSRSEFEVAKQRQQEIEKQMSGAVEQSRSTNLAEITIRELESKAKSLRSLHDTFLQRYVGAAQQESFPIAEARVMNLAVPPQSKSKPKGAMVMALGLVGGLGLGLGLGLFREMMDRVFRTSAQIESTLGLPCLSLVPALRAKRTWAWSLDHDMRRRRVSSSSTFHGTVVGKPLSRYAESIRAIKLAIDLNPSKASNKVIGITSTLPNEGKTTIAASLAQLIAHSGKSCIVVDGDLRNPSLSASLAANATTGIVDVISHNRSLEETIWRDQKTNLAILPAVSPMPVLHTSEVLAADSMRKLFDQLRSTYDYVIVDLPPLTPLVDVRSTTTFIDCYVLVVEWGQTKVEVVKHALHTAPNVYECLIGAVLNKTDIKAMSRYDTQCRDYYRDEHYIRYGLTGSN
ncbi:polysaccharide biosynthesis tyrosine autokinase [Bradyrhizobium sp. MOS001]|uniref:non-specific protein-tyrosine kinase n=1 Tax=Bradyrhizobium barranii subsp. barranii TaxID=2823807 RepID=A0A939S2Y3_9BRAD|nr:MULTISPECIES: polysaccharide biosynthesis tyrosine autokinase [Bradyrhizobium]TFW54451.1 polysaccharide biosynthesis tyrosine autokinase [Bradyrhizobium sp. MOS001]UEM15906.1 polysaccharide biosynthesis tyrosine autokinase [Bradyrhizobium barranii subsp. barranii]